MGCTFPHTDPSKTTYKLFLQVPNSCNMSPRCPYCWVSKEFSASVDGLSHSADRWLNGLHAAVGLYDVSHVAVMLGEPFSNPGTIRIMGDLSSRCWIDCVSNLMNVENAVRRRFSRPESLLLTASYHPHHWASIDDFTATITSIRRLGVVVGRAFIVGYPPNIPSIGGWKDELEKHDLVVHTTPFFGEVGGLMYPESYTDGERREVCQSMRDNFGQDDLMASFKGRLCSAGTEVAYVDSDGDARWCGQPGSPLLGNILRDEMWEKPIAPIICPMDRCGCPDLWKFVQEADA